MRWLGGLSLADVQALPLAYYDEAIAMLDDEVRTRQHAQNAASARRARR